jgi:Kef-type K+ transport system membrane component KefB
VLDDIIGLIILAVVGGLARGEEMTGLGVAQITAAAFGFLIVALLLGSFLVPPLVRGISRLKLPGMATALAVTLAFGLAWLAYAAGSAMLLGAFAAGILLRKTSLVREIETGIAPLGHFFVPLFFVTVGAAMDLRVFNPIDPANHRTLLIGGLLIAAAVIGKFLAGYAPFWTRQRKTVIGVGMIPRGEVGLIFAQTGLAAGIFDAGLVSAVTLMVMVTTFLAPPLLRLLFPPAQGPSAKAEGSQELVTEP